MEKDNQHALYHRAEQGDANGTGVEKDEQKAVEWYKKAAEQGHVKARNCLGV